MAGPSASLTAASRNASSTGDRSAVIELRRVVAAWEALPEGNYSVPREIERWLCGYMKPAIDAARAAIALSDHQNAPTNDVTWPAKRVVRILNRRGE